jgi:hypothetical protein
MLLSGFYELFFCLFMGNISFVQGLRKLMVVLSKFNSEKNGPCISCLDMVQRIVENKGIPYIAHINTSDYLGTSLYKRSLFGSLLLNIVGVTNLNKIDSVKNRINGITSKIAEGFS